MAPQSSALRENYYDSVEDFDPEPRWTGRQEDSEMNDEVGSETGSARDADAGVESKGATAEFGLETREEVEMSARESNSAIQTCRGTVEALILPLEAEREGETAHAGTVEEAGFSTNVEAVWRIQLCGTKVAAAMGMAFARVCSWPAWCRLKSISNGIADTDVWSGVVRSQKEMGLA